MRLTLAMISVLMASPAVSQNTGPLETPPADFRQATFVDSAGCVFSKAKVNGNTVWVPRLNASRSPVCDETPSFPLRGAALVVTNPVAVSVAQKPIVIAPKRVIKTASGIPKGYRKVWTDGRLNPNRGPQTPEGDASMARVWSNDVPMKRINN